jgi:hypothetical protein
MSDDEFEDILDEVYYYYPLIGKDTEAQREYSRAIARVNNTGGEEQRAQLQDLIDALNLEREEEEEQQEEDARG